MDYNINFPHLHIYMQHVGQEIMIGGFSVRYYGLIVTAALVMGVLLACHQAKKTGQNVEDYIDLSIAVAISGIIGARIYYVIFRWDVYKKNPISVFNIRQGGLAIYGGVIAAVLCTYIFCRRRKLNFGLVVDTAGLGLVLGQAIGRWGNFFNREAFGGYSDGLFAMQIPISAVREHATITLQQVEHRVVMDGVTYIQAHPTFLYESIWNILLLMVMLRFSKGKVFDGQVFLLYLCGYGLGRFWIESLRTDQLLIPVVHYPVSKALAAVMIFGSLFWMDMWMKYRVDVQMEENDGGTSGTSDTD